MEHSYDNSDFYNDVSPKDYLTYELVYLKREVSEAIKDVSDNKKIYSTYLSEAKNKCIVDKYDVDAGHRIHFILVKCEKSF